MRAGSKRTLTRNRELRGQGRKRRFLRRPVSLLQVVSQRAQLNGRGRSGQSYGQVARVENKASGRSSAIFRVFRFFDFSTFFFASKLRWRKTRSVIQAPQTLVLAQRSLNRASALNTLWAERSALGSNASPKKGLRFLYSQCAQRAKTTLNPCIAQITRPAI